MREAKEAAAQVAEQVDTPSPVLQTRTELWKLLKCAEVTQTLDLAQPDASELTAKFGSNSKFHHLVYPGTCAHLGDTPRPPPLRSALYAQFPELQGKRYATSAKDLDAEHQGIVRRWKKVRAMCARLTRVAVAQGRGIVGISA